MQTWVDGADGSAYDIDNLPYGVFVRGDDEPRVGVRIGELVLDLAPVAAADRLDLAPVLAAPSLNPLMAQGRDAWTSVRHWVTTLLSDASRREDVEPHLLPLAEVALRMPFDVGDYVDFYASEAHATNVGTIFRPTRSRCCRTGSTSRSATTAGPAPSSRRAPRSSGRTASGRRPDDAPTFGPSARLDIEAELGFVVGATSAQGDRVAVGDFADHVFGVVGLNDWSARDIQAWEYVPLGPFLGKSFATSISHWVTPLEALDAAWVDLPGQDPQPLDYLALAGKGGLDIAIEIEVNGHVVSRPPYSSMYWAPAQMLAHMTVNGASLRPGDLFASGTVSGTATDQRGSFLEMSWGWKEPFAVGDEERTALEDGDEVVLRYTAPGARGGRIALGDVRGRIEPAR